MNVLGPAIALASALALAGCTSHPTRADEERTIHALVDDWSAAAVAKDAARFASFYAEDAVLMLEDAPDMRGIAVLRGAIEGMMQDPNFQLSFHADEVEVARSRDLAYETGTYSFTITGPDGEPMKEVGHYVVVWAKQADGTWKVAVDAPISDPSGS